MGSSGPSCGRVRISFGVSAAPASLAAGSRVDAERPRRIQQGARSMIRRFMIVAAAATAALGIVASARGGRPVRSELAPLAGPGRLPVAATAEPEREPRQTQRARPRNVVIVLSDDHRYDFMSFMPGAPRWLQTPNLDRMRREGAHVRNAFVTTSLCSPSRASLLTGQHARRPRVRDK